MKRNIFLILTSLIFLIPLQLIAQTHHKVMVNQFGRNGYGAGATRQAEVRTKLINALDGLGFDMFRGNDTSEMDYVLDGNLSQASYTSSYQDGETTYKVTASLTVTLTRTSDNSAIVSRTFDTVGTDSESSSRAYDNAMGKLVGSAYKAIKAALGYRAQVNEITIAKNNEAKELIADTSYKEGAYKGRKMTVKLQHTVRGRTMFRRLGEVKVEENLADGTVRCKVTKGHKEIYQAYLDTPEQLTVQTD